MNTKTPLADERRKYRICFVSSLHRADDKRVHQKEGRALVAAGYQVDHVLAEDPDILVEKLDGVRLITYGRGGRGLFRRMGRLRNLYHKARGIDANAYHCNEADSWIVGAFLRRATGRILVRDVHELDSTNLAQRYFPVWMQPSIVFLARGVFKVLARQTDRLVFAKASVALDFPESSRKKQVLVQNYVELTSIDEPKSPKPSAIAGGGFNRADGKIRILHLGAINRDRGWPQILDALSLANDSRLELNVVGRFGDDSKLAFFDRVKELGLQEQVLFRDWIPYSDVASLVRSCDIGVLAFQPNIHNFVHALPHKLFDYMYAGLAVVVPACSEEVARIVSSEDCGIIVDTSRPEELASAFIRLAGNPGIRRDYGMRGRKAVESDYNWTAEAARLVAMYDEIFRIGQDLTLTNK